MAALTGGRLALDVVRSHGVDTMFTLSGAHIFPLYDAAVTAEPAMRIVDVRHEQTAVFADEATAKLTRTPGFAALTAGPGVTNGVSAVAQAHFNGTPLLVLGGRAPAYRWGSGSLQELDHPPPLAPVTRSPARPDGRRDPAVVTARCGWPRRRAGGRRSSMCPWTNCSAGRVRPEPSVPREMTARNPDADDVAASHGCSRVPNDGAGARLRRVDRRTSWRRYGSPRPPACRHHQRRRVEASCSGHKLLVTKGRRRRSRRRSRSFSALRSTSGSATGVRRQGRPAGAGRTHRRRPSHLATHVPLAGSIYSNLTVVLDSLLRASRPVTIVVRSGIDTLAVRSPAARSRPPPCSRLRRSTACALGRVYRSLLRLLGDDAVVISDGGDFVSSAAKLVEPARPSDWLDPGPYGCLARARGIDRGPARPAGRPGRLPARTAPRGYRCSMSTPGPAPAAGGAHRQRRRLVEAGEAPDADAVRL